MATLYIAEFSGLAPARGPQSWPAQTTSAEIVGTPPIAEQTIAIGGVSAQSNPVSGTTKLVRVHADSICSIAFGDNPTASTSNMRLVAGQTEYFGVSSPMKIAVISNT